MKKKKILVLADHPLSPSGVGTQTKYMIEALLKTGRYQFMCLGGAVKHQDYTPQAIDPRKEDWRIFPVDGYGTQEMIRSIMSKEKPDLLWFMTDPRFYGWLWEIENEVRANVPMVYYHVWDNFPAPKFNSAFYESNDEVVCISKVTHEILKEVAPDVSSCYHPHAVDPNIFRPFTTPEEKQIVQQVREQILNASAPQYRNPKKKIFFWNNRNARRKQSGTLIWWFKADFTINISDAEGFGLSTLESLSCGTPIIVNMTGGLQEQVTNGTDWFGYGIEPTSKVVIGSLQVPYIYEDRLSQDDFTKTLISALKIRPAVYKKMSKEGRKHVIENYGFDKYEKGWVELMDSFIEKHGSWETRKNHQRWHLLEVA